MSAPETVPVKVEDLNKWAMSARGNAHIGQAEQIERYIPKPEQPVKVLLSELAGIKNWVEFVGFRDRLEASDEFE